MKIEYQNIENSTIDYPRDGVTATAPNQLFYDSSQPVDSLVGEPMNEYNAKTGYIKLYRSILDWEWYQNHKVYKLFTHLLLTANHQPSKWQGISIERGQLITSVPKLASTLCLSNQSIRSCINKLKSTNEITIKTTNKFTIITICNYDDYQSYDYENNNQNNNQSNNPITNEQQTNNKQITTNKNVKNDKNVNNEKNILFERFWILYDKKVGYDKVRKIFMRLSQKDIELIFNHVPKYVESTTNKKYRKNPSTYLNGKHWNDEIEERNPDYELPEYLKLPEAYDAVQPF